MNQSSNGQPAHPIPFYKDTRPWYIRLWHQYKIACGADEDELLEPYWIPMEPPILKFPRG